MSNIYVATKEQIVSLYWEDFVLPLEDEMLDGAILSGWGGDTFSGKTHTPESIQLMSKIKRGKNNPLYGKNHSEETKRKMSEAHKGVSQSKIQCPHCNKTGGHSIMKRWHFDNCRDKS